MVLKGRRRGLPLSPSGLDEVLDGARARAGLARCTCHQLRHTCLTRLREQGMALEAVQAQAGHASIESTRIYLHLANDWLAREYLGCRGGDRRAARPARRGARVVSRLARDPEVEALVAAYRADLEAAGMFAENEVTSPARSFLLRVGRGRLLGDDARSAVGGLGS